MKSKTCLSLFVGHCCQNFGTYMFLTQLPTYMKEILKFDIKSVRDYLIYIILAI
jgi:MFS transporter, ACS family, solute carrier family 17 (sodium-dependent inorganic phosphate cotransporter), member 5